MILGKGAILSLSLKQNINAKSSTEGQLLGAHDGPSVVLCRKNFIKAKGYTVEQRKLYQDNKSTILMENNGIYLSSKRTKHVK